MRFDLVDLRLFLDVVEAASITHGAARSNLALASASARIRGMEDTLGAALLERSRRGVTATAAGLALAHHARVVLQQIQRMRGELNEYASGLRGSVRVLSNTVAMTEFLPRPMAAFLAANPNIDLDLDERPSHVIVQALEDGLADVGLVADTTDVRALETFPFVLDRLVLLMPRRHPLARRRRLRLREVTGEDFVGLEPGSALQQLVDGHAHRLGHSLRLRVRVHGLDAVCEMVGFGVGLAVVPERAAVRARRTLDVRGVRLADDWATRTLVVAIKELDALPAHARRLVAHLQDAAIEAA
jgi:DNA-binding transcriptional LysR family regulator